MSDTFEQIDSLLEGGFFVSYDENGETKRISTDGLKQIAADFKIAVAALEHYADRANWQEDNTPELTTYCVWKRLPDQGNELWSGPDKAAALGRI